MSSPSGLCTVRRRVLEAIDEQRTVRHFADLIRVRSVTGTDAAG